MAKKVLKALGNLLTVLAIALIVYRLYKMDVDLSVYTDWEKVSVSFILGLIFALIAILVGTLAWKNMLETLSNKHLNFRDVFHIYSKANIGKYLPGNVMHYVERNLFAAYQGLGQIETLSSTVFELLGQLISAMIIAIIFAKDLLFSFLDENLNVTWIIIAVIALIIMIVILFFLYKKNLKIQIIVTKMCSMSFLATFGKNLIIYAVSFVANGITLLLSLYAMQASVTASSISLLFAMNTTAWLIGFIIPGVPGGIGVRELVLATMASGTQYSDIILVAAVGQRVVLIFGDFAAYIIGALSKRKDSLDNKS